MTRTKARIIKRRTKALVDKYEVGQDFSSSDTKLFTYLLVMYDMSYEDPGLMITKVSKVRGKMNEVTVEVTYSDGTTDIVGYKKIGVCSRSSAEQIYKHNLINAMRIAVKPTTHIPGYHGHHAGRTFHDLSSTYLEHCPAPQNILFESSGLSFELRDSEWKQNWIEYHNDNADIQYLTPEEHKKIHHGGKVI
jgi:hypothetical protein